MSVSFKKHVVLVVDDDLMSLEMLLEILAEDYFVVTAQSAEAAVELLEQTHPDLILLDIVMPGMDGYALFQFIREKPQFSTTPVLFLTCLGEHGSEALGLKMGAVDYITKPYNPHLIKLRVRNHLLIKQQQDELLQERELFSGGPVISIAWGPEPDWPVRRISPNVFGVLGYSPNEMLDPDFRYASLIHPDDLERVSGEVSENINSMRDSFEQSYRLKLKSGCYKCFYDFTRLERNDNGIVTAIRGYMFDQSKLKQAEEAAEAANRAKTEFLNNMSHELRTPLNGIYGMAQLLRYTELTDEQSEFLDTIDLSVTTLTNIISDILDITKLESDQIKLENGIFSPGLLLQEVITAHLDSIQQKGLTLAKDIAEELAEEVTGDQKRTAQILQNLLSNAVKFTERGNITVSAAIVQQNAEQTVIRITVCDTGIGMTSEVLQRIFMPFIQADSSTTRRFGGTGLGLSISRKLAELMGGTLKVESEPGIGSSFHLELPFITQVKS